MSYTNLLSGPSFYRKINLSAKKFMVSVTAPESGVTTTDVSAENNESILLWYDSVSAIQYIYTPADKIYLNSDSSKLFSRGSGLESIDLSLFDTSKVTDMSEMFSGCAKLTSLDASGFDTSNVTNTNRMFANCTKFTSLNITNFNTFNVTNMSSMFVGCSSLTTLDLSNWNTSNVTDMSYMFYNCSLLDTLDLSNWNTSNVTNMVNMFYGCKALTSLDLSNWNTSNVTDTGDMFYNCSSLASVKLSNWNTSNVTNMSDMFNGCSKLTSLDASNWDTSNVTDMSYMFSNCSSLSTLGLSYFDISNATDTSWMFNKCSSLTTLTVSSNVNASKVTDMSYMFDGCKALKSLDLSKLSTDKDYILSYDNMFNGCILLESVDISGLTTYCNNSTSSSLMVSCNNMFAGTHAEVTYGDEFKPIQASSNSFLLPDSFRNTYEIGPTYEMFLDSTSTKPSWDGRWTDNGSYIEYAYIKTGSEVNSIFNKNAEKILVYYNLENNITPPDTGDIYTISTPDSPWKIITWYNEADFAQCILTEKPRILANDDMSYLLSGMTKLTYIYDIFDTIEFYYCKNISHMLDGCIALTDANSINRAQFEHVIDMSYMLKDCESLYDISFIGDIDAFSYFNTPVVENVSGMFQNCINVANITINSWLSTSNLTNVSHMFENCRSVEYIDLNISSYDSLITNMEYMFAECSMLTHMDLLFANTTNVTDMTCMFRNCSALTGISYRFNGPDPYFISNEDLLSTVNQSSDISNKTYQMFYRCAAEKPDIPSDFYWSDDGTLLQLDLRNAIITNFRSLLPEDTNHVRFFNIDEDSSYSEIETSGDAIEIQDPSSTVKIYLYYYGFDNNEYQIYTRAKNIIFGSMNGLFSDLPYLEKVTFSDKIDISGVTDMKNLFSNCPSLVNIIYTDNFILPDAVRSTCVDDTDANSTFKMFNGTIVSKPNWTGGYWSSNGTFINGDAPITEVIMSSRIYINGKDHIECKYADKSDPVALHDISKIAIGPDIIWQYKKPLTEAQFISGKAMHNLYGDSINMTAFVRSNTAPSESINTLDASKDGDKSIVTWYDADTTTQYWYSDADIIYLNEDCLEMFNQCSKLIQIDLNSVDSSKVTRMYLMFNECSQLTTLDMSHFDTSNVTDTGGMFYNCSLLTTLDVSNWNTSKVTNMSSMFRDCSSLTTLDVSGWNTSNTTNMASMFNNCSSLTSLDVSHFDTSKVTNMSSMFRYCSELTSLDVSHFNTSNVTDMQYMFNGCSKLESFNLSNFNTSKVTNMQYMFNRCSKLESLNLSSFNTSKVTNMQYMFNLCPSLTTITYSSNFVLPDVVYNACIVDDYTNKTYQMFNECNANKPTGGNWDLGAWNSNGAFMKTAFLNTYEVINTNINKSATSFVKSETAPGADIVTTDISKDTDGSIVMWYDADTTTQYWYSDAGIIYMNESANELFANCSLMTSIDISNWNASNVTSTINMFYNCSSLTSLDLSKLDVSNVTLMINMFDSCSKLTSLDVSTWNTSNVTNMTNMFGGCSSLATIDVSKWDVSNVTHMTHMFYRCSSLTTLDVSKWNMRSLESASSMFSYCISLNAININSWVAPNVNNFASLFQGCTNLTELELTGIVISNDPDNRTSRGGMIEDSGVNRFIWHNYECTAALNEIFAGSSCQFIDISNIIIKLDPELISVVLSSQSVKELIVANADLSNTTSLNFTFPGNTNLTSIDVSGWDTSNITSFNMTFTECSSLTSIDLSSWDTSNATILKGIFNGCTALASVVYGSNFVLPDTMYQSCTADDETNPTYKLFSGCDASINKPTGGNWDLGTWSDTGTFIKS